MIERSSKLAKPLVAAMLALALGLTLATVSVAAGPAEQATGEYVGSEVCADCHAAKYNDFRASGHPWKLRPAAEAQSADLPLPAGLTWDDISYVVGGFKWKARYVDQDGFIITSVEGEPGKNQYNVATGTWSDYEPGTEKKYDCGNCHTTGYSKEGQQDNRPGIVGTWAAPGVQCEACHGPGGQHVAAEGDRKAIKVDRSTSLCATCHTRGTADIIPAAGGFVRHQEQNNELQASPHQNRTCVTCHDPHKKAEASIKRTCAACHPEQNSAFQGSSMQEKGVTCVDCHMPAAMKSAVSVSKVKGDVKSHLFRINTDAEASMFSEDGTTAKGFLTVDFACLSCHQDKDVAWAASNAKGVH